MAIETYDDLQTAVENWLDRSDLTARVPEFISLAEVRFRATVRHWRMQTSTTLTLDSSGEASLPADYLEAISVSRTTNPPPLKFLDPASFDDIFGEEGTPGCYTIVEGKLKAKPLAAEDILLRYLSFASLTSGGDPNWLLTYFPNVYLFGALVEAEAYTMNDTRVPLWKARLDEALADVEYADSRAEMGGGAPVMDSGSAVREIWDTYY